MDGQNHQTDYYKNRRYHINSDNVCNTKMEREEKNFKERERYRNKIKDESFKENKRKKDLEYYHKNKEVRVAKQIERRKELYRKQNYFWVESVFGVEQPKILNLTILMTPKKNIMWEMR